MTAIERRKRLSRYLTALVVLSLAVAPASAVGEITWKGAGWYAIKFGLSEHPDADDEPGWLEVTAGPYQRENLCEIEAKRLTAAETEYMVMYFCRLLDRRPISNGAGGIKIWVPGERT